MKEYTVLCAAVSAILVFASCGGSKESAYRKAYEKAKAQEQAYTAADTTVAFVAPLETKAATETTVVDNYDNVVARTENVTVVNGSGLKPYSVVVGSFSLKTNAEGLQTTLKSAGYDAQIAYNADNKMYRVIASTFDRKGDAAQARNTLRTTYPDAWLLFKQ